MDIPSLSDRPVGSRFVSQDEIDLAKARKDEQWKAAYARLGQDPPPQQQDDAYDGRSLAEKLAANRIAKQEEWEEKNKLGLLPANQFRALEEDEIQFLDSIRERQETEERQRKQADGEELKQFKQAVAARASSLNGPPPVPGSSQATAAKATTAPPPKKLSRKPLKGIVVVKKKTKDTPVLPPSKHSQSDPDSSEDADLQPAVKRRKVLDS